MSQPVAERPLDTRIHLHEDERILEVDLTDMVLRNGEDVAALYNLLERRAAASRRRWFFLVNYLRCQIHPEAWISFANRGKRFNKLFSLGSVRFNTAEEIGGEISRRADAEAFEANLIANRDAAVEKLRAMRAEHEARHPEPRPLEDALEADFDARISFDPELQVMDADFSDFSFVDSRIVNGFYDVIEKRIAASGRPRWYFAVNYANCKVYPEAWIAFAQRGKKLNLAHSLGSVRYAACDLTSKEIATRAESDAFDPNLFESRDAALAEIDRLRSNATASPAA
ncbi:MAG: hypothetical protein AAGF51_16940 [Pseudomonadota bacterium]